jgi:hypothetical protein
MAQQQQHDRAHETRERILEAFSKLLLSAALSDHYDPDMVIWAVYACMLGRTERSARLREPSFTPN